ncbi:unnamed protein product [Zymoseptoria tritici ST99CH_1A5]|uniref:Uncharacterized protein n=1 Tax=Zymoseptoria tritici ST99CH_1A5 TaxID=1276529 RepID=A0A1Y6L905_ZYMTR|nr:unnamed protein product [Zymoseptoria tritici ST99CH_1A5]
MSMLSRYGYPTYRQSPTPQPVGRSISHSRTPSALNHLAPIPMPDGHVQSYPVNRCTASPPAVPSRLSVEVETPSDAHYSNSSDLATTTVLDYLTAPNPTPSLIQRINDTSKLQNSHFWFDIRNLRSWTDFNINTISTIPGLLDLLQVDVSASSLPVPSKVNTSPETPAQLAEICASHHAVKVNAALKLAQGDKHIAMRTLRSQPGARQQPEFVANYQSDGEKTIYGDGRGRVVGIVKSYDQWNSGYRHGSPIDKVKYLEHLAHLHRFMREHGTRYGFLMTEIELVCVRMGGPPTEDNVPLFGFLEVSTPIQISAHGTGEGEQPKMTAGLALWYLHMLAKEQPFPGQFHWRADVGGPTAGTRKFHLERDEWMPKVNLSDKRVVNAKSIREQPPTLQEPIQLDVSPQMDDYSLQQELEALAGNAFNPPPRDGVSKPEPIRNTAARWRKLFLIPEDDVIETIMTHRSNLTRTRISDDHWEAIRAEMEAQGYDREAYEYELDLQKRKAVLPTTSSSGNASNDCVYYLVELSGPLDTAEKVQRAAKMTEPPAVVRGESVEDDREVELCCINGVARAEILRRASLEGGGWEPTILEQQLIPNLNIIRYISDDENARYHPPAAKGREALMYFTYLQDFYDELADINIFVHAEDVSWHMDAALLKSLTFALAQLDLEQVMQTGYVNLRTTWGGSREHDCPNGFSTSATLRDNPTGEAFLMGRAFHDNFPDDPMPEILAGPCCSQFAVTKDAIRSRPLEQYQHIVRVLVDSNWSDQAIGRPWERMWPWLFKRQAKDCNMEYSTLCRLYGVCFRDEEEYKRYEALWEEKDLLQGKSKLWREIWHPKRLLQVEEELEELLLRALDYGSDAQVRHKAGLQMR